MTRNRQPRQGARTVRGNSTGLEYKEHARFEEKRAIKELTKETKRLLKDQASKGIGADGQPYPRYDPEYAKRKARAGKSVSPNLKFTGRFLRAIRRRALKRRNGTAELVFSVSNRFYRQGIGLVSAGFLWAGLSKAFENQLTGHVARARLWVSRRGAPSRRRKR